MIVIYLLRNGELLGEFHRISSNNIESFKQISQRLLWFLNLIYKLKCVNCICNFYFYLNSLVGAVGALLVRLITNCIIDHFSVFYLFITVFVLF